MALIPRNKFTPLGVHELLMVANVLKHTCPWAPVSIRGTQLLPGGCDSDSSFPPSIFCSISGGCSDTVGNPGSSLPLCVWGGTSPAAEAHERRCWEEEPDTGSAASVRGILHTLPCMTLYIKHTILLRPPGCIPSSERVYRHSINLTETCCAAANVGFCGTVDFQRAQSELAPREQAEEQTHVKSHGALCQLIWPVHYLD